MIYPSLLYKTPSLVILLSQARNPNPTDQKRTYSSDPCDIVDEGDGNVDPTGDGTAEGASQVN